MKRTQVHAANLRRRFVLPVDAPVLCDDAAALNPERPRDRLGLCRRMLAVLRRRARRTVRAALRSPQRLRVPRGRPGWHAVTHPARLGCCALTDCRYNLAEFYREKPLAESCALMVANKGGATQEVIADLLGMARNNVSMIERAACAKGALRSLVDRPVAVAALEERVRSSLQNGERGLPELVRRVHARDDEVLAVLDAMVEAGEAAMRVGSAAVGRRWWLTGKRDEGEG